MTPIDDVMIKTVAENKLVVRAKLDPDKSSDQLRIIVEKWAKRNKYKPTYWYKRYQAQALCHKLGE